jgi:hypothetical protein
VLAIDRARVWIYLALGTWRCRVEQDLARYKQRVASVIKQAGFAEDSASVNTMVVADRTPHLQQVEVWRVACGVKPLCGVVQSLRL